MLPFFARAIRTALALSLLTTPAAAATFYVSPGGNDANPGTLTAPFATPARALAVATHGDTVLLRGGSYPITQTLHITQTALTFASYPGERARIVGGTTDVTNLTSIILVYSSQVTIERLELEGASYYGVKLDDYYGAQSGSRLRGLYIHHTGRDGIKVQKADGLVIEDCEIAFTGVRDASNAEGIDIMATIGVTVRRNYIHDVATNGLFVKAGTRQALVEANRIERTGYSGILLGSESDAAFMRDGVLPEAIDSVARNNIVVDAAYSGLGSVAGDNIRFEHNTVVNVARSGQAAFRAASNQYGTATRGVVLYNNVFVLASGSTRPMVHLFNYSGAIISDSNIWFSSDGRYQFWRESATASNYWTGLSQWRSGMNADWASQSVDPRLDATSIYHLLTDSPAIDRGISLPEVTTDFAGIIRPQGLASDIGAHERPIATVPPPPDPTPTPLPVTMPAAPASLTVTQASRTAVTLRWTDASNNEEGFRIERSSNGGAFTVIATVAAGTQTYTGGSVKVGKPYKFRVVAYNSAGASAYSNTVSITIAP